MSLNLRDRARVMSKCTPRKAFNATKVLSSYYLSKWSKKPIQWGMPISISIEPTTACNLGCPECPSGLKQFTRPTGNIDQHFYKKIIDQLAGNLWYLTFYFQGEPYIHPGFHSMVNYASAKGIYTSTSTNAHFLDDENCKRTVESGLDRLIISIDGITQQTYEAYRVNGHLDKVISGTKNIIRWKKKLQSRTPNLIFQFLVVKPNEHEMAGVKQLAQELGVDEVKFKTAQVYNYKNGHELIPTDDRYSRYKRLKDGTYKIKNSLHNQCWRLWHSCVITWDGKVVPCCFDKDARHLLGDLQHAAFRSLWWGEPYKKFRTAILESRSDIGICQNCTEGTKVWT